MGKIITGGALALLSISLIGLVFFSFVIAPKWKDSFVGYGVEISSFQMLMISISDLMINYWFIGLPLIASVCVISFRWTWK